MTTPGKNTRRKTPKEREVERLDSVLRGLSVLRHGATVFALERQAHELLDHQSRLAVRALYEADGLIFGCSVRKDELLGNWDHYLQDYDEQTEEWQELKARLAAHRPPQLLPECGICRATAAADGISLPRPDWE